MTRCELHIAWNNFWTLEIDTFFQVTQRKGTAGEDLLPTFQVRIDFSRSNGLTVMKEDNLGWHGTNLCILCNKIHTSRGAKTMSHQTSCLYIYMSICLVQPNRFNVVQHSKKSWFQHGTISASTQALPWPRRCCEGKNLPRPVARMARNGARRVVFKVK